MEIASRNKMFTLLTWSTLLTLLILFILFELLYTACMHVCLYILIGKVRTLLECAGAQVSKKWEWVIG